MKTKIFVFIEHNKGSFADYSIELLNYANHIISDFMRCDFEVSAIVFSHDGITQENKELLHKAGAENIIDFVGQDADDYTLDFYSNSLKKLVEYEKPHIFLFSATYIQKEVAPTIAVASHAGLTADCSELKIENKDGKFNLIAKRPTFGNRLYAEISYKSYPQMATLRVGVKAQNHEFLFDNKFYKKIKPEFHLQNYSIKEFLQTKISDELNKEADIMFALGFGAADSATVIQIKEIVNYLNANGTMASYCASRKVCEEGLIDKAYQVGQTGSFVSPKLYIALGISGAIHHLVGCDNSQKIICINTDENCEFAKNCDYFLKQDAKEFIAELHSKLCG
ncbi:electron transfer flavoprotein subunit alpha/FixB family protein [bacterium]|nr:electron transfer flavoprotein subunit alpha/FixB family protein [bacterium]